MKLSEKAKSDLFYFQNRGSRKYNQQKDNKKDKTLITGGTLINAPLVQANATKTSNVYRPHTLSKKGIAIHDDTFTYDRSVFGYKGSENKYADLKKGKEISQRPDAKTITTEDAMGMLKTVKSPEKRFPIEPTTGKELSTVRHSKKQLANTELDHIVPLHHLAQVLTPPNKWATEFVKKKWGTKELTSKEWNSLLLSKKNTQLLSVRSNQDKSNKRLKDYGEFGWGTKFKPQTYKPERQAQTYHDVLVDAATKFKKKGLMSREDAKVYREITGKEPHPILDAENPEFSPPAYYAPSKVNKTAKIKVSDSKNIDRRASKKNSFKNTKGVLVTNQSLGRPTKNQAMLRPPKATPISNDKKSPLALALKPGFARPTRPKPSKTVSKGRPSKNTEVNPMSLINTPVVDREKFRLQKKKQDKQRILDDENIW